MGRWFVNQGDAIRANLISSAACGITVYVTILTSDGEYRRVRSNVPFTTNGTRVAETAVVLISTLPEGEVLSMNVATFTPNIKRGQCYIVAYVIEQPTMAAGYVFANHDVLLGDNVDPGPAGGHGFLQRTVLNDPAAGAEYTNVTVPTGAAWKLRGFIGVLVTAATAANREFTIRITDSAGSVICFGTVATEIQTATLTVTYIGGPGLLASGVSSSLAGGSIGIGMPDVLISAGSVITFITSNLQGLDDWGQGQLYIEEWLVL